MPNNLNNKMKEIIYLIIYLYLSKILGKVKNFRIFIFFYLFITFGYRRLFNNNSGSTQYITRTEKQ